MRFSEKNREEETEVKCELFKIKEREEIIPKSTILFVKDVAKRPLMARALLYLNKHGLTYQKELEEFLNCSQPTLSVLMSRLSAIGLVKIIKTSELENPIDKRLTYYRLPKFQPEVHEKIISELKKWYEYEMLKSLENYIKPYVWVELDELRNDEKFNHLIFKKFGLNLASAIDLMASSPLFYAERDEDGDIVAIKRKFDSYGRRIEVDQTEPRFTGKVEAEELIEEVGE